MYHPLSYVLCLIIVSIALFLSNYSLRCLIKPLYVHVGRINVVSMVLFGSKGSV